MKAYDTDLTEDALSLLLSELRNEVRQAARSDRVIDIRIMKFVAALDVPASGLCVSHDSGGFTRITSSHCLVAEYFDGVNDDGVEDTLDLAFKDGYASVLIGNRHRLLEFDIIRGNEAGHYDLTLNGTLVPREFGLTCELVARAS